jgi:hypothetical protein
MRLTFAHIPAILFIILLLTGAAAPVLGGDDLPDGFWDEAAADTVLAKTLTVRLAPDLSDLNPAERIAIEKLLVAGAIFQELYEESRHHQALEAYATLRELDARRGSPPRTAKLLDLYRLFKGPIATSLANRRVPFLPVDPEAPGRNVYPPGVTKEDLDRYLDAHPDQRDEILHLRGVVRRADARGIDDDLQILDHFPAVAVLHPGLLERMNGLAAESSPERFYGVPYSLAYAPRLHEIFGLLHEAAAALADTDPAFARYLRLRGRDLLTDDYEAGDAAWVTGRFGNLNAQVGSYETYDDELYGVKTFFSLSLLLRDHARSDALQVAVRGLQEIEDALPYAAHKRVREDIPIGVYEVIADFGQSRGRNTATILPNESHLSRQYGRTILLRANILKDPDLFAINSATYNAVVHPDHHADLDPEGTLQRTLWHEIGHYLGVDRTGDGRDLDQALQEWADLFEELKSDLVSLFAVEPLRQRGYFDARGAREVYADGVRRVLQKTPPRREQPYQTMQLMQWNYYMEKGLYRFDADAGIMRIHWERYPEVVASMLREVLAAQREGDRSKAEAFIERWTAWSDDVHGVMAAKMRDRETYRFVQVRYAALGE